MSINEVPDGYDVIEDIDDLTAKVDEVHLVNRVYGRHQDALHELGCHVLDADELGGVLMAKEEEEYLEIVIRLPKQ